MDNVIEHMTGVEKLRIRRAAFLASRVYPGPVGDLIFNELISWDSMGWRFGGNSRVMRLVDHVIDSYEEAQAA